MIKDITIGQYYAADSVIHQLDARVKLFAAMVYIIAVFSFRGLLGFVILTAVLMAAIWLSKVPLRFMVRGMRSVFVLLLITAFFSLFMTAGVHVYWSYGFLKITDAGIVNAILMVVRLSYLVIGTSLLTLTTTPNCLTDGLEKSLHPLTKLHLPVHEVAMMMSIALRFIPILMEETDKIMKAQMARGADFESGGIFRRMKNMVPLLVPLFVSAFRRADDLALAMESRCYTGGAGRTKLKPLRYERRDRMAYLVTVLFLAAVIAARILLPWPL